jgi:hypothetical protein
MYRLRSKVRHAALAFFRNTPHPVGEAHGLWRFKWFF